MIDQDEFVTDWIWRMDYCKQQGIPPAQAWAWDKATVALHQHKRSVVRLTPTTPTLTGEGT